jgi:hypothetical protein
LNEEPANAVVADLDTVAALDPDVTDESVYCSTYTSCLFHITVDPW